MRTLPALRLARQAATRTSSPSMITFESSGWGGPGLLSSEGLFQPGLLQAPTVTVDLSYWDLHFFLLVPTLWLLTAGRPGMLDEKSDKLTQTASLSYIGFILSIAVAQAFVWDSVGAQIGIHNPSGERVGEVSHLRNEEYIYLVATPALEARMPGATARLREAWAADGRAAAPAVV